MLSRVGEAIELTGANGGGIMMGLLSLLALASIGCLLVGLISPGVFSPWLGTRSTRKFVCGASAAICFVSSTLQGKAIREAETSSGQQQLAQQTSGFPDGSPAGASAPGTSSQSPDLQRRVEQAEKEKAALQAELRRAKAPASASPPASRASTTPKPANTPEITAKEQIELLVRAQLGNRFRQAHVASEGKAYRVTVEFKAGGSLDKKGYVEGDMMNVYKALYTSGIPLSRVSLKAYDEEEVDKFGRPRSVLAYHTALSKEAADKISWDNYKRARWTEIWTTVFLHSQYAPEPQETAETAERPGTGGETGRTGGRSSLFGKAVALHAEVSWSGAARSVEVTNTDFFAWTNVQVALNPGLLGVGAYTIRVRRIGSGETIALRMDEFTNASGERFDYARLALRKVTVIANTPEGKGIYTGQVQR